MTERAWAPVLAIPALWLAHVAGAYTAASLRCHDVALEEAGAVRVAMGCLTLAVGGVLVAVAIALTRRARSDQAEAQLAGFVGLILAGIFGAYLIWSLLPILAPEGC